MNIRNLFCILSFVFLAVACSQQSSWQVPVKPERGEPYPVSLSITPDGHTWIVSTNTYDDPIDVSDVLVSLISPAGKLLCSAPVGTTDKHEFAKDVVGISGGSAWILFTEPSKTGTRIQSPRHSAFGMVDSECGISQVQRIDEGYKNEITRISAAGEDILWLGGTHSSARRRPTSSFLAAYDVNEPISSLFARNYQEEKYALISAIEPTQQATAWFIGMREGRQSSNDTLGMAMELNTSGKVLRDLSFGKPGRTMAYKAAIGTTGDLWIAVRDEDGAFVSNVPANPNDRETVPLDQVISEWSNILDLTLSSDENYLWVLIADGRRDQIQVIQVDVKSPIPMIVSRIEWANLPNAVGNIDPDGTITIAAPNHPDGSDGLFISRTSMTPK